MVTNVSQMFSWSKLYPENGFKKLHRKDAIDGLYDAISQKV
jgi:hypothetical protein